MKVHKRYLKSINRNLWPFLAEVAKRAKENKKSFRHDKLVSRERGKLTLCSENVQRDI